MWARSAPGGLLTEIRRRPAGDYLVLVLGSPVSDQQVADLAEAEEAGLRRAPPVREAKPDVPTTGVGLSPDVVRQSNRSASSPRKAGRFRRSTD